MKPELLPPLQWTLVCALLIGLIFILRLLLQNKKWLPRKVWLIIWWLALLRLLLPVSMPVSLPISIPLNMPVSTAVNLPPNSPVNNSEVAWRQNDDLTIEPTPAEPTPATKPLPWETIIWASGTIAAAGFFSLVYWRSRRRFRRAAPLDTPCIRQWLANHALRRQVSVRQSDAIDAPLTYGLVRPVILLPANLPTSLSDDTANPDDKLHYALLHEWTHIRHFDAAGKLLAAVALCLHWFNPAIWLFFLLFSRDMELACDADVALRCGNRREYALALLSWAENCRQPINVGLMNSFSSGYNKQNVIEERIVAIMNVKKVSILTLAVFGLLLAGAALAFATPKEPNQQQPTNLLSADMLANPELIDYTKLDYANMSDEELHQMYSEQARAEWAMLLEPYAQFGLGWQFDDPDFDGNGLKMYYQGHEVSGIYDETTGVWLTEHTGNGSYGPGAVELHTVYTDGQLSGLRLATPEEQAQWDAQRAKPMYKEVQPYEQFGLEYGEQGRLFYNGQPVRYFWDGYDVIENGQNLGRAIHFEYINQQGKVDLRTRRDVIYNADGSVDQFGELQGVEVYEEKNFIDLLKQKPDQQVAYAAYDEAQADDIALDEMPQNQVTYAVHSNPDEEAEDDQTIAERLAQYEQFGLEYREEITPQGARRNIYFQGELVSAFIDNTRSSGLTVQSSAKPEQPKFVMTEYDERGRLAGLRLATEEEANERINRDNQSRSIIFTPGYNADGEPTLYYSTDNNRTHKAIAKPE